MISTRKMSSNIVLDLKAASPCDRPCEVCANLNFDIAVQLASQRVDLEIELNGVRRAALISTRWSKTVNAASQRCGACTLLKACISEFQDEFCLVHDTFIGLSFHIGRTMMVTIETERVLDERHSAIELFVTEGGHLLSSHY